MPMESGVPAELLPEGFTDILEVQEAVGDDKGIGRRLLAVCKPFLPVKQKLYVLRMLSAITVTIN